MGIMFSKQKAKVSLQLTGNEEMCLESTKNS